MTTQLKTDITETAWLLWLKKKFTINYWKDKINISTIQKICSIYQSVCYFSLEMSTDVSSMVLLLCIYFFITIIDLFGSCNAIKFRDRDL